MTSHLPSPVQAVQAAMPDILDMEDADELAAKIIRALVESVLPMEVDRAYEDWDYYAKAERQRLRGEFLSIADGLEAA